MMLTINNRVNFIFIVIRMIIKNTRIVVTRHEAICFPFCRPLRCYAAGCFVVLAHNEGKQPTLSFAA